MSRPGGMIPLKYKSPIKTLLQEAGRLPFSLVLCHMRRNYAAYASVSEAKKRTITAATHQKVYHYLAGRYSNLAQEDNCSDTVEQPDNSPIWMFWWQGESQAPEIVKKCIRATRKHSGHHPVYVIDEKNYRQFIDVPSYIEKKYCNGIISLTHFSDYYRMALLERHGGLWIDASVFAADELPKSIWSRPLFTVRNPGNDEDNISNWEWMVGVIGGRKGHPLFTSAAQMLAAYLTEYPDQQTREGLQELNHIAGAEYLMLFDSTK